MKIRRAVNPDSPTLAALNAQLIHDEGHRNPMSTQELEARMQNWLAGEYKAYLIEEHGMAIGYVLFREDWDCIYVRHFFIQLASRRQGYGRAAFTWLTQRVWVTGQRLRLEVLVGNRIGVAFWHALGFLDYSITMERDGDI